MREQAAGSLQGQVIDGWVKPESSGDDGQRDKAWAGREM